ncbi:MAG: hypothetical protein H0W50_10485 [Parachlamydiaceae bacterium]|nr:hypothetical protein [Parachlamydiaceae bacterium]
MIESSTLASKKRTIDSRENDAKQSENCTIITSYNPILDKDIISEIFFYNFSLNEFKLVATLSRTWSEFARNTLVDKIGSFKITRLYDFSLSCR